jgi:hypothetical protein
MTNDIPDASPRWKYLWFAALVGLPALAWYGVLDQYSSETINSSTAAAGLVYATARGINALVSVLQGTELNAVLLTFSIGEVLDPINDLIERFSTLVLFALGSLALQQILLTLVSHAMFNAALSILAIGAGIGLMVNRPNLSNLFLKGFLVIALLRFSLGLVVVANGWVDATFLVEADEQRHVAMVTMQNDLRDIDALASEEEDKEAALGEAQSNLGNLQRVRTTILEQIHFLGQEITKQDASLDQLVKAEGLPCARVGILIACPDEIDEAGAALEKLEIERTTLATELQAIDEQTEKTQDKITCLHMRRRGEDCSLWDKLPEAPSPLALQKKLGDINANLTDFADNCINLLMSLLLKTIIIPLIFMYTLLKVMRLNWSKI